MILRNIRERMHAWVSKSAIGRKKLEMTPSKQSYLLSLLRHVPSREDLTRFRQMDRSQVRLPNPLNASTQFSEENFFGNFYSNSTHSQTERIRLQTYRQLPPKNVPVHSVCVLLHGMNWHSNLLAHVAQTLASAGIAVCAYDFKGYGKSEGIKGYLPSMEVHNADATSFIEQVQQQHPNIPLFLCGFSLGGLTAFNLAIERPLDFTGLILLAPAIKEHPYFFRYSKYLARSIGLVLPMAKVTAANRKKSNAQRNLNVESYLLRDDAYYYKGGQRAITVKTICEAMMDAETNFHRLNVPFLLFQGGKDRLIDPKIGEILERATSPALDKTIVFNEHMWHGIPLEPEIDSYTQQIISWIKTRSIPRNISQEQSILP